MSNHIFCSRTNIFLSQCWVKRECSDSYHDSHHISGSNSICIISLDTHIHWCICGCFVSPVSVVGAYVGMASLGKISSIKQFAFVSLLAAGWGLALTPFFVGFAGSKCNEANSRYMFQSHALPNIYPFAISHLSNQNRGLLPCLDMLHLMQYSGYFID